MTRGFGMTRIISQTAKDHSKGLANQGFHILKGGGMQQASQSSIREFYQKDHDQLEVLFRSYQMMKRKDPEGAIEAFGEFRSGVRRHMNWEEEILFPIYEARTGKKTEGPTVLMKQEHEKIREALDAIHGKVSAGDLETDLEEERLLLVLSDHHTHEESLLYPAIDHVISPCQVVGIFRDMDEMPMPVCDHEEQ